MPNPNLTPEQLEEAKRILQEVEQLLQRASGGDPNLAFAYRRKLYKELSYIERGKPGHRKRLKRRMMKLQEGKCFDCKQDLPERGAVLDRHEAVGGYVEGNVDLVCRECDARRQGTRGYS